MRNSAAMETGGKGKCDMRKSEGERKKKKDRAAGDKWQDMNLGAENGREPAKGKSDGALLRDQGRWERKKRCRRRSGGEEGREDVRLRAHRRGREGERQVWEG